MIGGTKIQASAPLYLIQVRSIMKMPNHYFFCFQCNTRFDDFIDKLYHWKSVDNDCHCPPKLVLLNEVLSYVYDFHKSKELLDIKK